MPITFTIIQSGLEPNSITYQTTVSCLSHALIALCFSFSGKRSLRVSHRIDHRICILFPFLSILAPMHTLSLLCCLRGQLRHSVYPHLHAKCRPFHSENERCEIISSHDLSRPATLPVPKGWVSDAIYTTRRCGPRYHWRHILLTLFMLSCKLPVH